MCLMYVFDELLKVLFSQVFVIWLFVGWLFGLVTEYKDALKFSQ